MQNALKQEGRFLVILVCICGTLANAECIHHWELDEVSGKVAHNTANPEALGMYRHLPKLGQATLYPKLGKSVLFAGGKTAQDIELPNDKVGLGTLTENFTVLAWVNLHQLTSTNPILSGRNGNHNWSFMVLSNGILRFQTFDENQKMVGQVFNLTRLAVDTWYMVGVSVAQNKTVCFFVDGDLDRKIEIAELGTPTKQSFYIAGRGQEFDGASINGMVADLQIYNSVLDEKQIQTHFQSVIPE